MCIRDSNPDGQIVINSKSDCLSPVEIAKEIFSYLKKICNNFLTEAKYMWQSKS